MAAKPYKRSVYLIKTGLQLRYMTIMLISMLIMSFVVGWTIYYSIWDPISSEELTSIADLAQVFHGVNNALVWRLPFILIIAGAFSVFLSHKIAGPVYKFEQSAKRIAAGDLTLRIKLRKGDEMQSLADIFNSMTESLENLVITDRKIISRIIGIARNMPSDSEELKSMSPDESKKLIAELGSAIEDLRMVTGNFIVSEESSEEALEDTSDS